MSDLNSILAAVNEVKADVHEVKVDIKDIVKSTGIFELQTTRIMTELRTRQETCPIVQVANQAAETEKDLIKIKGLAEENRKETAKLSVKIAGGISIITGIIYAALGLKGGN